MFGKALQRARVCWIGELGHPQRALIVGEGNGRFLCELLRAHPELRIDCVDESARMNALAKERLSSQFPGAHVRFVQQDVLEWTPENSYDVIVTHFVLDCFDAIELTRIVKKLAHAATPDVTWLLADFSIPSRQWARMHARIWLHVMYAFFRLVAGLRPRTLVDPTCDLLAQGFVCAGREVSRAGMLKSEMWRRGQP
jgi:ubiquinone/menaquinone biosynthesis C-methylase UbiE